ncbi:hypothetical protein, partial [Bradyrhizobium denitrificans]|uniref:hypothetical protein n=1 Tax=Bradyrhizobium denitrificans TaxID=2734912 RepID=UPI001552ED34
MVEDDEGPATRDVRGVVGLPLRLKPLDLGFKLAEGGDFLRAEAAFLGQFLEGLELIGRMQRLDYASSVLLAG